MSSDLRGRLDPRRLVSGARTRVLLAFVILLALSTLASTLALRQILLARASERVDQALVQEVEEFRKLVKDGRNPLTGEPFGSDVESLFDVFLQRNVPSENEAIFTFVDGVADIREMEKGVLWLADIDEGGVHSLNDPLDLAEIDRSDP